MIDPDAALTYLWFVAERHRIWERRQRGQTGPWTVDPVLRGHKFTNVFRVLDFGSQYVLTDLIDESLSPQNQLMRLFLYRHTGRVEAWQYLSRLPRTVEDLDAVGWEWSDYKGLGVPFFTNAYLVFPQSHVKGTDKLTSILDLTRRLWANGTFDRFVDRETPAEQFAALRENKGVADFMSMQILTDWGYTPHCGEDREDAFVVCGPGARRGAQVLDSTAKPEHTVQWAVEAVRAMPDCPMLDTGSRFGPAFRVPSLMDVQNTLCEFSKYARWVGKPSPQHPYTPAHPGLTSYVLPKHLR